ncbi:MAG: prenyltransferase/squalene oxidase repeat-containing protein [Chloroflexota bacterium]
MGIYDKNLLNALDFLTLSQNLDGGWGYRRDGMSYTEPTVFALLALLNPTVGIKANSSDPRFIALQKGLVWLRRGQHSDGGWGVFFEDGVSNWMTYPATWLFNVILKIPSLFAAYAKPEDSGIRDRAESWIIERGREAAVESETLAAQIRKLFSIDSGFRGWSWGMGEAGWVIPTSMALIALVISNPKAMNESEVVKNGKEYLRDRACPVGGWNVGNPWMLGKALPPTPDATSFALLAWRLLLDASDFGSTSQLQKSITLLSDFITNSNSDQTIVLGTLAVRLFDENAASLNFMINGVTRQFGPDNISRKTAKGQDLVSGGWANSAYTTAFAALALSDTRYFIQPA